MAIPQAIPTPTATPAAVLTPMQKYQLAMAGYGYPQASPTATPGAGYGSPVPVAPPAPDPLQTGLTTAAKVAALKMGASAAMAPSVASSLGAGVAGTGSALASSAAGLKGAALGANAAAGTAATPAATGVLGTGMGAAPLAGIALATYLGGKAGYDMLKGKKPGLPGRIILGIGTGGLSEVAKATGLLGHKSTKEYQSDRWGDLAEQLGTGNPTADYITRYQQEIQNPSHGGNPPKRFGEMQGIELTPGEAFFKTFGRDWLEKYTEPQRIQIAQKAKDEGLLYSSKGDIRTGDTDALKALAAPTIASMLAPQPGNVIPRKDSPGFKDGKRINYGKK